MFYVNSYVFTYKKDGIMYLRGRSMREIAIKNQVSQEFIDDLFNNCKELSLIEEVLGSKLTYELLSEKILVSNKVDIESRYSRTKGYYSLFYDAEYKKLQDKTVLVLGAGALGSHISLSLSMYGVRRLIVADYDIIENSNLNRQILYTESDVGKEKILVLSEKLHQYNSDIQIESISINVASMEALEKIVSDFGDIDFIVKAIDTPINIIKVINEFAVLNKIPYISGGFNGCFLIIDNIYIPGISSCFSCRSTDIDKFVFPGKMKWPTTPEMPSILGGIMTSFIIKILLGYIDEVSTDKAYIYSLRNHTLSQEDYILRRGECSICKKNNKVEDNNNQVKLFSRLVYFCMLSAAIAFLSTVWRIPIIETQLIVLIMGIILSTYYAYSNKGIQELLENIVLILSSFEILFVLFNFRIFGGFPIDIFINVMMLLILWIFIMLGVACLGYYVALLFREEI